MSPRPSACPVEIPVVLAFNAGGEHGIIGAFGFGEVAGVFLHVGVPPHACDVFRIELRGLGVVFARLFGSASPAVAARPLYRSAAF